eukprot:357832-Chlamydomonas_euryale.AAC.14
MSYSTVRASSMLEADGVHMSTTRSMAASRAFGSVQQRSRAISMLPKFASGSATVAASGKR